MKLSAEQMDALCEYVDGRRAAGLRYDEIADALAGSLPEDVLEGMEKRHRAWSKRQWQERERRGRETESLDACGEVVASAPVGAGPELPRAEAGGVELVRYMAGGLLAVETRAWVAEAVVERPASWSGFPGDPESLVLYVQMRLERRRRWKYLCTRALEEGQVAEQRRGAGQEVGVPWLCCAVVFRTGARVDHVEPEARIRNVRKPETPAAKKKIGNRTSVELEKLQLVESRLALEEIGARHAAVMQTFLGKASGIKSGAELARLTGVTRQAVSARKLLIAEDYYGQTGGKAGFDGLHSAQKHREEVNRKDRGEGKISPT